MPYSMSRGTLTSLLDCGSVLNKASEWSQAGPRPHHDDGLAGMVGQPQTGVTDVYWGRHIPTTCAKKIQGVGIMIFMINNTNLLEKPQAFFYLPACIFCCFLLSHEVATPLLVLLVRVVYSTSTAVMCTDVGCICSNEELAVIPQAKTSLEYT